MKLNVLMGTLVLSSGTLLFAQDGPPPPQGPGGPGGGQHARGGGRGEGMMMPPGPWWRNADVAAKVGLSADQVKKIEQVFTDNKTSLMQLHSNVEQAESAVDTAMNASAFNQGAAQSAINNVADARAALEKADAKMLLSIRALLTPEQWTKLQSLHRGFGPGGDRRGGRGQGAPGQQGQQGPPPQGGPREDDEQ